MGLAALTSSPQTLLSVYIQVVLPRRREHPTPQHAHTHRGPVCCGTGHTQTV